MPPCTEPASAEPKRESHRVCRLADNAVSAGDDHLQDTRP